MTSLGGKHFTFDTVGLAVERKELDFQDWRVLI